jgi:hypothetical protein
MQTLTRFFVTVPSCTTRCDLPDARRPSSVFPNDGRFNSANKNEVFGKDRCPIGYSPGHQGSANFLVMETNTPVRASDAREGSPSSPPCTRCASSETEPVVTMRRHTVDADPWYHCEECGHVFTTPRDE